MNSFLSRKGKEVSKNTSRVDMEVYFEAMDNLFHPTDNPRGALPMNVAENQLCWSLVKNKIQEISRNQDIPDWVAGYGDPAGIESFRESIAKFLSDFIVGDTVESEGIAISGGATGVIELSSFLLADPGDTVVIPAPSYPVYTADMGVMPDLKRFDLQTHHEIEELKEGIPITLEILDDAKSKIEAEGSHFKILVLTSPDNPTGMIYSETQLRTIAEWCIHHEIHLIVNEIYAMSQIDTQHSKLSIDYPSPISFFSFGKLMNELKNPLLHYWYSFSKDFGISGFRVGVLYSQNEYLIAGYRNAGLSHSISNHTQWILDEMLRDRDFLNHFFDAQKKALTNAYLTVRSTLMDLEIKFNPIYGSLFVWIDLSDYLPEQSQKGETDLWREIYDETGILITPSNGFGHSKKGLFRLVITSLVSKELKVAMDRFRTFILSKKK